MPDANVVLESRGFPSVLSSLSLDLWDAPEWVWAVLPPVFSRSVEEAEVCPLQTPSEEEASLWFLLLEGGQEVCGCCSCGATDAVPPDFLPGLTCPSPCG